MSLRFGNSVLGLEIATNVRAAAALHEVTREPAADALAPGAVQVCREAGELLVEQTQQRAERVLVAAVRRGRDQQDVALGIRSHAA